MALPQTAIKRSVEDYLTAERAAEERHEYLDGDVYLMAGESLAHGFICTNLVRELSTRLRGTSCGVLSKDMKVRTGTLPLPRRMMKGLFSYPDALIVCGEPQFHDEYRDILLNPTLIIEVLSDSTETYDRTRKFMRYQQLESLAEYVLVSQNLPLIEVYARRENGWFYTASGDPTASVRLASVDCSLALSEVYDRITFPEEPPPDEREE